MQIMRPILIAECCQNHNGSFELLKRMVEAAAQAGADYVKIQSIRSHLLTHRPQFDEGSVDSSGNTVVIKRPYSLEKERLSKLDLTIEQEAEFVKICHACGVKAMTTPFTRATVKEIEPLGFDAIKVASYDCGSIPLIEDVVERWDHIFVSTGASTDDEIKKAAHILKESGKEAFFLHCVTIYPTSLNQMHLARIPFLRTLLDRVGLSSHPLNERDGIKADMVALALGADCIERHFTLLEPQETKDGPVSIVPSQLKSLREFSNLTVEERLLCMQSEIPNWKELLGCATRQMSQIEQLNRMYYRGRFADKIDGHDVFTWEDLEVRYS